MPKRSLYQCFNARVESNRIRCAKGHVLSCRSGDGSLNIERLARGEPLVIKVCQDCPDFESMGKPVLPEERGWIKLCG